MKTPAQQVIEYAAHAREQLLAKSVAEEAAEQARIDLWKLMHEALAEIFTTVNLQFATDNANVYSKPTGLSASIHWYTLNIAAGLKLCVAVSSSGYEVEVKKFVTANRWDTHYGNKFVKFSLAMDIITKLIALFMVTPEDFEQGYWQYNEELIEQLIGKNWRKTVDTSI